MNSVHRHARNAARMIGIAALAAASHLAFAQGQNGTTLAATKTLDICEVTPGQTWRYSGIIAVWNAGVLDTQGLQIQDVIQNKTGTTWVNRYQPQVDLVLQEIPAGTSLETATSFPYSIDAPALSGDIRNVATVTILNHSGSLGTAKGPSPKATYAGTMPPPPCHVDQGCVRTQGYWGNKPDVVWPAPFDRADTFYLSNMSWQEVMDSSASASPGYYQLAHQFIAAVLNKASGAAVPSGVQTTLSEASAWLSQYGPAACATRGSCGIQKGWATTLDEYNNGAYPGGPAHCD